MNAIGYRSLEFGIGPHSAEVYQNEIRRQRTELKRAISNAMELLESVGNTYENIISPVMSAKKILRLAVDLTVIESRDPKKFAGVIEKMYSSVVEFESAFSMPPDEREGLTREIANKDMKVTCANAFSILEHIDFTKGCGGNDYYAISAAKMILVTVLAGVYER